MERQNFSGCLVTEDYLSTAAHIFECCRVEANGLLPVNILRQNLSSLIKTETKRDYKYLISLLDPDDVNPSITVKHLADALEMLSLHHSHNRSDLDESFNSITRNSFTMQDSDSGIGSGYNMVEELQTELKEKIHALNKLRGQLEFSDRQHEEAITILTSERDSLRDQLHASREENATMSYLRKAYEEWCEREAVLERALAAATAELEATKRKHKAARSAVDELENERLSLQGQVSKSREECHRINELYASRQATIIEENERLKADFADLSIRYQDQEEFLQKVVREKVLLEMEVKDLLNKSTRRETKMDTSVECSYSEQQILQTLDTMNSDEYSLTSTTQDEFYIPHKQEYGKPTNLSLFDELRQSMDVNKKLDCEKCKMRDSKVPIDSSTQTDICNYYEEMQKLNTTNVIKDITNFMLKPDTNIAERENDHKKDKLETNNSFFDSKATEDEFNYNSFQSYSDSDKENENNDNAMKCSDCAKKNFQIKSLHMELSATKSSMNDLYNEISNLEEKNQKLSVSVDTANDKNTINQSVIDTLQTKLVMVDENLERNKEEIKKITACKKAYEYELKELKSNRISNKDPISNKDVETQTRSVPKVLNMSATIIETVGCQTEDFDVIITKKHDVLSFSETKHVDVLPKSEIRKILKRPNVTLVESKKRTISHDVSSSRSKESEDISPKPISSAVTNDAKDDEHGLNKIYDDSIKVEIKDMKNHIMVQTDAWTQANESCASCDRLCSGAAASQRSVLRRLFSWDTMKRLIHTVLLCLLLMAGVFLYGVCTQGFSSRRCSRDAKLSWDWMGLNDFFGSIVKFEYVGEVPM